MNISPPGALKDFVAEQVTQRGYGTNSEQVRELIRRAQARLLRRSRSIRRLRSFGSGKPVTLRLFHRGITAARSARVESEGNDTRRRA